MGVLDLARIRTRSVDQDEETTTELPPPRSRIARFYRSTWFNVVIVGLVSFTQPGIWSALNSKLPIPISITEWLTSCTIDTGAGGEEKPYLVNAANALTYGLMAVCCPIFGAVANRIGLKWTLVIGVIGYTPYSASLYCNNRFGNEWFVYVGAALCGIGASALWSSDAAIAIGYPLAHERVRLPIIGVMSADDMSRVSLLVSGSRYVDLARSLVELLS